MKNASNQRHFLSSSHIRLAISILKHQFALVRIPSNGLYVPLEYTNSNYHTSTKKEAAIFYAHNILMLASHSSRKHESHNRLAQALEQRSFTPYFLNLRDSYDHNWAVTSLANR